MEVISAWLSAGVGEGLHSAADAEVWCSVVECRIAIRLDWIGIDMEGPIEKVV